MTQAWIATIVLGLVAGAVAQEKVEKADPDSIQAKVESVRAPDSKEPATIEVCFVLDTTGSMSGLIEGAKRKIWSIANEIVAVRPPPTVRIALVGYRDRRDEYVTRHVPLTDDLDLVYSKLTTFRAQGGNDQPESVNQALHEAVTKVPWSDNDTVLKIVFLVGDAPPHMDYEDDVKYPETCRLAARRGIIINTIQCGGFLGTREIWQEIARRAEGEFVALAQSGNMTVASTPMDEELASLNVAIGKTIIAYGTAETQREVWRKQLLAERAETSVAADRLAYNARTGLVVQGGGDLLDAIVRGSVKLETLEEEKLPENMKKMTPDERKDYVERMRTERAQLRARIDELVKKRKDHIEAGHKRPAGVGKGARFDAKVAEILKRQAAGKGIHYDE